jgi:hypothetical protein
MSFTTRLLRFIGGIALVVVILVAGFALSYDACMKWGATAAEQAAPLPGDALLPNPDVQWTNATTIDAPPAAVWPWIAQIADNKGGFYSYTWIEDRVGALTGSADYKVNYTNANAINPAWQNPQPGDQMIQGLLNVSEVKPGEYLLAESAIPDQFGWTWLFQVEDAGAGQTRLINRARISGSAAPNPVLNVTLGLGGSIMNRRMMNGLEAHPEGWVEPSYMEGLEMALWFAALVIGLVAAVLFLARRKWMPSLLIAALAVVVILVLTFVQPAIWVRVVMDVALVAGLAWAFAATAEPAVSGAATSMRAAAAA